MQTLATRQYCYLYGIRLCSSATVWLDFILIFSTLTFIFDAEAHTLALAAALYGVPSLIFGPYIGSLPDRYSPRAIIAVSFCVRAITATCLLLASNLELFLLFISLKGLSNLGSTPAEIVLTARLLPPTSIIKNTSLVSITDQTIKIIAPLAAGLSITWSNSTYGFLISAGISLNGLIFVWLLSSQKIHAEKFGETKHKPNLNEVLKFFASNTTAQAFLLCMLVQSAALGIYDSLLSLFMKELSLSSASFGQVVSATAIGGIIAGLAFPQIYRRHFLLCATVASSIFGVCLCVVATVGLIPEIITPYSFPILFLIAGFAYGLTSQGFTSTLQLTCPSRILGTAFSTARSCAISLFIVLPAAGAWLAGITSTASVIMTAGLLTLISAGILHIYYLTREASDVS
ncbi:MULTISPECIES: MFS transporter [Pseudomonas]|uniref:MFS transporter n=1 Tax=Pseudomonas TaxID=286 RepID=UPI000318A1EE|nr:MULTISPECIES: MFS transporter [Pseudomonas]